MKVCVARIFHLHSVFPAVDVGVVLLCNGMALASGNFVKMGNA